MNDNKLSLKENITIQDVMEFSNKFHKEYPGILPFLLRKYIDSIAEQRPVLFIKTAFGFIIWILLREGKITLVEDNNEI